MKRKEFVDKYNASNLNTDEFYKDAKFMFIAMMGLDSKPEDQVRAIMTYLGEQIEPSMMEELGSNVIDIKKYIKKNLDKEKYFYIVEKEFWDLWI